nr:interleukin 17F1 [Oostethus manadensis]
MTSAAAIRIKGPGEVLSLCHSHLNLQQNPGSPLSRDYEEETRMLWLLNAVFVMVVVTMSETVTSAKTHRTSSGATIETVPVHINPKALVSSRAFRPLQNDSISPWTYNVSHDISVFPPVSEARCLLRGCLDSNGVEDLKLKSAPILHQVLLLHRVKSRGTEPGYHYRLENRLIAVGCTCVRDPVLQQE